MKGLDLVWGLWGFEPEDLHGNPLRPRSAKAQRPVFPVGGGSFSHHRGAPRSSFLGREVPKPMEYWTIFLMA